jgi:glycosyltransferase involved in cell wall biosynthesis
MMKGIQRANGHKPIDVLMIAKNDWANTGYRFWRCLLSLGLNVLMVKGEHHAFHYPVQAPIHPSLTSTPITLHPCLVMAPGLESLMASAHVIHTIASTWPLVPFDWENVNVVNQHGGQTYRLNPDSCNAAMDPQAKATIIQCPDLLGLGASNEHLIYYPVDTEIIQPQLERYTPKSLVIGHFPSSPNVKGTNAIYGVIRKIKKKYPTITYLGSTNEEGVRHWLPWEKNIERMSKCDVIIETLAPKTFEKDFGEWGNTALEAAAAGCIVISNCLKEDVYKREYGELGIRVANDPEALELHLEELVAKTDLELHQEKEFLRDWAVTNHSMEATAERIWQKIYKEFF